MIVYNRKLTKTHYYLRIKSAHPSPHLLQIIKSNLPEAIQLQQEKHTNKRKEKSHPRNQNIKTQEYVGKS